MPFGWVGSKYKWADSVWDRLGNPDVYIEPFAGTAAILLGRREWRGAKRELINDLDGFVTNFWRSAKYSPDVVAEHLYHPTNSIDLKARHAWLLKWGEDSRERLLADPEHHDPKAAAWWAWGSFIAFNNAWCNGSDPTETNVRLSHYSQRYSERWDTTARRNPKRYMEALHDRLRHVVVMSGDWKKCVTNNVLVRHENHGATVGIVLDPPYLLRQRSVLYGHESEDAAQEAMDWAIAHGEEYRIAYFCTTGDFDCPEGWTSIKKTRKTQHDIRGERKEDHCFFSPACIERQPNLFDIKKSGAPGQAPNWG